jgi:hypothetical protein
LLREPTTTPIPQLAIAEAMPAGAARRFNEHRRCSERRRTPDDAGAVAPAARRS